jgi:hypothetical protein
MQENLLFEYAVIRVVPHVEREEFLNIGVILYCSGRKFLGTRFHIDEERIRALCRKLDISELRDHITSFQRICEGGSQAGPIGKLPIAERFRWLTATRSTVLQTSRVHPGLCTDPQETTDRLFTQLVLLPA